MPLKRERAAKAAAAAKRARQKVEALADLHPEDAPQAALAAEARDAVREAAAAAEEIEAAAQRQHEREEALKLEDPTLWERFKKWFD